MEWKVVDYIVIYIFLNRVIIVIQRGQLFIGIMFSLSLAVIQFFVE